MRGTLASTDKSRRPVRPTSHTFSWFLRCSVVKELISISDKCVRCFDSVVYFFIQIFFLCVWHSTIFLCPPKLLPCACLNVWRQLCACMQWHVTFHLTSWITNLMKIYFSIQRQSRRIMNDAEVLQRNKLPPFSWRLCAKNKETPQKRHYRN